MNKFIMLSLGIVAIASGAAQADVKVYKHTENFRTIVLLTGDDAANFYAALDAKEEQLTPWQNVGKRVLDKDGNIQIQCMKYDQSPLDCEIVVKY